MANPIKLTVYVGRLTLLAASYASLAIVVISSFAQNGIVTLVWPSSGLALAALLLGGNRYWPGVFMGALLANLATSGSVSLAVGIAIGNTLEAVVGGWLLTRHKLHASLTMEHLRDYFRLMLAGGMASCVAAVSGSSVLALHGVVSTSGAFFDNVIAWWKGDALGIFMITPLLLVWRNVPFQTLSGARVVEGVTCLALCLGTVWFANQPDNAIVSPAINEEVIFLLLVWSAVRFGLHGVLLLIPSTAMFTVWLAVNAQDAPVSEIFFDKLNHLWFFVFTMTVVGITLALKVMALRREKAIAEHSLQSEADTTNRFKQAQQLSKSGCWELDIPSGELHWSDEIYRIFEIDKTRFGASYEAFLGAIHPEDRALVSSAYETSLKNHTSYEIAHRLLMPDGRIKWVNDCCETYYDPNNRPLKSIGTLQDVTQHKKAENSALIASEARLRAIFNTVIDAIIIIDERGVIEMVNSATAAVFGYLPEHMLGKNVAMLMPSADRAMHDKYLSHRKYSDQSKFIAIDRELMALHKSGRLFPIELSISDMQLNGRRAFVGVLRDITDRKKVKEALELARNQAETANLAKGQFLATMTHELRTPLNSVLGMLQLVLMEDITERQRDCLLAGQKAGVHLLDIINNILDYTKVEAGKVELKCMDFSLSELTTSLHSLFDSQIAEKQLQLHFKIAPSVPPHLYADPLRLKQILINLLQNAIKFTVEGNVTLTINVIGSDHDSILRFEIRDTGIGISEDDKENLFHVFHQVDNSITRKYSGTGLGLAICKQLVELMGGKIGVDSRVGEGSIFWFTLPLQVARRPIAAVTSKSGQSDHLHGMRVLLVDSNPASLKQLSRMLMGRGVMVSVAASLEDLQKTLQQPACNAVLVVAPFAGCSAGDLVKKIREQKDLLRMPLVVLVESLGPQDEEYLRQAGGISVLSKPVDNGKLLVALKSALRQ